MKKSLKITAGMAIIIMGMSMAYCSNGSSESTTETKTMESSIDSPDQGPVAPLDIHTAAYLGDINSITQHINSGTDLNQKDQYGSTPLIIAITFDKTDVTRALIKGGADLTVANNDGSTPLHIAAFFCRPETVKMLLENGADMSIRNKYGSTARETVAGPFDQVRSIYDQIGAALQPLGLKLDYEYLEATRPQIADMLK